MKYHLTVGYRHLDRSIKNTWSVCKNIQMKNVLKICTVANKSIKPLFDKVGRDNVFVKDLVLKTSPTVRQ